MALNTKYREQLHDRIYGRKKERDEWWAFINKAAEDFPTNSFISKLKKWLYDNGYLTVSQMRTVQEMYTKREQEEYLNQQRNRDARARDEELKRERAERMRRENQRRYEEQQQQDSYNHSYEDDYGDPFEYFYRGGFRGGWSYNTKSKKAYTPTAHMDADPYDILGVSYGASTAEIKQAYMKLAKKHHPDRGGDTAMMAKINDAYDKLTGKR